MPKRVLQKDISIRGTRDGYMELSAMVDGYRESQKFLYYTQREAKRLFQARYNDTREV